MGGAVTGRVVVENGGACGFETWECCHVTSFLGGAVFCALARRFVCLLWRLISRAKLGFVLFGVENFLSFFCASWARDGARALYKVCVLARESVFEFEVLDVFCGQVCLNIWARGFKLGF